MQCLEKQLDRGEVEFVDKVFPGSSDSGFAILTSLGRSLDCMLMMEFVKASCHLEIKDEMEWEPNRLWRAVVGHLVGRRYVESYHGCAQVKCWRGTIIQNHAA